MDDIKLLPATTEPREPTWEETGARARDLLKRRMRRLRQIVVAIILLPFRLVRCIWEVIW